MKNMTKKERSRIQSELLSRGLKQCLKCNEIKSVNEFSREKRNKDKLRSFCRECDKKQSLKYRNDPKNKERITESRRIQNKRYRENNREKIKIYQRNYQRTWSREYNKRDYVRSYQRKYHREHQKEWIRKRMDNDLNYKIKRRLRDRLRMALKNCAGKKAYKTMELLGCNIEFFKNYIALQFQDGMSWDNYGYKTWHIDHIIPCNSFDLTDPEQQKKCFHYTNLQPLWAKDNLLKGRKCA